MGRIKIFLQTTFLGGFLIILPVAILVAVFNWIFEFVTNIIQPLTNFLVTNFGIHREFLADFLALSIILIVCFFVGLLVRTRFGRFLHNTIETRILKAAPGYTLIKETVLQLLGNQKKAFSTVVLAKLYDNDTMVTGFLTDEDEVAKGIVSIFVPTGPNPTSGFIYHLPKKNVYKINVSVEYAMRSVISMGAGSSKLIEELKKKR